MSSLATFPSQAESWLDERGKGAWIAAMVLGFILFWPVGLALLFYMIYVKRIFACCGYSGNGRGPGRWQRGKGRREMRSAGASGNSAFDTYREETLRRLEEEQAQFESFLARLRHAKDKAEFDQFMAERGDENAQAQDQDGDEDDGMQATRAAGTHPGIAPPAPNPAPGPAPGAEKPR